MVSAIPRRILIARPSLCAAHKYNQSSSSDEVTLLKATEYTTRIKNVIREPGVALSVSTSPVTDTSGQQEGGSV